MTAGATDEQAKSVISHLAAAKPSNEHLKQAFRVELCRWFLPYLAQFPETAEAKSLAAHYFAADVAEPKPDGGPPQAYQQAEKRLATLLAGHPNPLDKKATVLLCSQLHVRYFANLDTPWLKRDRSAFQELETELQAWPEGIEPDMCYARRPGCRSDNKPPTHKQLKNAGRTLRAVHNVLGKYMVWTQCSTMMQTPRGRAVSSST